MALLFAYLRVSTEDQAERNTIQNQRNAIERYLKEHPDIQVKEWFEDEAYSGSRKDRPRFIKMLDRLDEVDGIIAWDISRVTRDLKVWSYIMFELRDNKKTLTKARTGQTDDYAQDRTQILTAFIEGWSAEGELKDISDRIKEGIKTYKAKNGRWGRKPKNIDWKVYDHYKSKYHMPDTIIARMLDISDKGPVSYRYLLYQKKARSKS